MKVYLLLFCLLINFLFAEEDLCYSITANITRTSKKEYYLKLNDDSYWMLNPKVELKVVESWMGSFQDVIYSHPVPNWMREDRVQILRDPSSSTDYPVQIYHPLFNETVYAKQIDPMLQILDQLDEIAWLIK